MYGDTERFCGGSARAFEGVEAGTMLGGRQSLGSFSKLNYSPLKGVGNVSGAGILLELYGK